MRNALSPAGRAGEVAQMGTCGGKRIALSSVNPSYSGPHGGNSANSP